MHERNTTETPFVTTRPICIARRFEGFGGIANGGHLAGELYRELGGPVEVTLRRPTPVETPLWLRRIDARTAVLADETGVLVNAVRDETPIDTPPAVALDEAIAVRETYRGRAEMPIPSCFVCGVERSPADALRLFSGELRPGRVAATWVPGPAFADASGEISVEHVIAALDCPGAWAVISLGPAFRVPMVLGRISARWLAPVRAGLPHVVVGSATGHDGRKHFANTAVYDTGGRLCAAARSIWFPRP